MEASQSSRGIIFQATRQKDWPDLLEAGGQPSEFLKLPQSNRIFIIHDSVADQRAFTTSNSCPAALLLVPTKISGRMNRLLEVSSIPQEETSQVVPRAFIQYLLLSGLASLSPLSFTRHTTDSAYNALLLHESNLVLGHGNSMQGNNCDTHSILFCRPICQWSERGNSAEVGVTFGSNRNPSSVLLDFSTILGIGARVRLDIKSI